MATEERGGFISWLSKQALPLRVVAFTFFVLLAIGLIFGATFLLYSWNVNNYPRLQPVALIEGQRNREFAQLPDDDSYPAALAVSDDGIVYTGSYLTGAVWRIAPDGSLSEIPQSREQIGSVISIETGSAVYVLDHLAALNSTGAKLWQIDDAGISLVRDMPEILQPNDVTVDDEGRFYISDLQGGKIFRLDSTGLSVWWQVPSADYAPAGLLYENGRILISDALRGEIYAIPTNASETESERTVLFDSAEEVGFNGIALGNNGILYAADLLNNEVWEITPNGGARRLAGNYRGSSNVAYDATLNRLYVNNWDQSWLLPKEFFFIRFDVAPRLPFSIDVIETVEAGE